jgi:hypothetical protein
MYAHLPRPFVAVGVSSPPLQFEHRPVMAKRTKSKPQERGSVLFDVVIEDQDRAISEKSGRPLRAIRSLTRSPARVSTATDE